MKASSRLFMIATCLLAAIGCYVFSAPTGSTVFLVAGLVFEALFWFGVFNKTENSSVLK